MKLRVKSLLILCKIIKANPDLTEDSLYSHLAGLYRTAYSMGSRNRPRESEYVASDEPLLPFFDK